VQDPAIHDRVVQDISGFCESLNLEIEGTCASSILGPAGNREFFILARKKEQMEINLPKPRAFAWECAELWISCWTLLSTKRAGVLYLRAPDS